MIYLLQAALLLSGYCLLGYGSPSREGARPSTSSRLADAIASYLCSLFAVCASAFVIEQLLGVALTPVLLLLLAGALGAFALAWRSRSARVADAPLSVERVGLAPAPLFVLGMAIAIFAVRAAEVLFEPLQDWDTFLYHLDHGRQVAAGHFPGPIGPDPVHVAAAYPPLFYFLYGINTLHGEGGTLILGVKLTTLLLSAAAMVVTWDLARERLQLGAMASATALLLVALVINPKPAIQSLVLVNLLLALRFTWALPAPSSEQRLRGLAPAAIFWAAVYWSNYTGALLCLLFVGWLVLYAINDAIVEGRSSPRPILMLALLTALMISPHLLRNLIVAGNPLYPALLDSIGGVGATPFWLETIGVGKRAPLTLEGLPLALARTRALGPLTLGALLCLPGLARPSAAVRLGIGFVLGAFLVAWVLVLDPTSSVSWRYLQPLLAPTALVIVARAESIWTAPTAGGTIALFGVGLLAVVWMLLPFPGTVAIGLGVVVVAMGAAAISLAEVRAPAWSARAAVIGGVTALVVSSAFVNVPGIGRVAMTPPVAGIVVPSVVLAAGLGLAMARAARARGSAIDSNWASGLVLVAAIVAGSAVYHGSSRAIDVYLLDIRPDLAWMNRNLPRGSRILTPETRLFTLHHEAISAYEPRLEAFYSTRSAERSIDALLELGVTHIYFRPGPQFAHFEFFSEKHEILPGRNPRVRALHRSATGIVAEIVR